MKLPDIIRIDNPADYKLHFAKDSSRVDGNHPLDDYLASFETWLNWHRYPAGDRTDRFNRQYVLSFMDFSPKKHGTSLFGGIFEVLSRHPERNDLSQYYDIRLVDDYKYLIGEIVVRTLYTGMATVMQLENYYDSIEVVEILPKRYLSVRG